MPTWRATRELRIDGDARDLSKVSFVRVDRSGTIYVGQPQDTHVRVFAADGTPVRTLGRKGGGPGEFRFLENAGFRDDAFWAEIPVSVFGPDGKVIPTPPVTRPNVTGYFRESVLALLPDGDRITSVFITGSEWHDLLRVDPRGAVRSTFIDHRTPWSFGHPWTAAHDQIFGFGFDLNETIVSVSVDGEWLSFVNAPVYGDSVGNASVTLRRSSGSVAYSRRVPIVLHPIPKAEVDTALAFALRMERDPAERARITSAPRPVYYPPLQSVQVARDGSLLMVFHSDSDDRQLLLLSPDGTPRATIRIPKDVEIRQVEGDLMWGIERNNDGIESIVRYRIHR
jgi:hypothetical protein